ncbi:CG2972 CG2972PAlike, partial [Caligus rogercresseyi]
MEFSKKTGDFPALSATDIKVIALTLDYHIQHLGKYTLEEVPQLTKTVNFYRPGYLGFNNYKKGFYYGNGDGENDDEEE